MRPAARVPVPPVLDTLLAGVHRPDHHMRCTGTNFMVTAGASIRLGGAGGRDGAHFVVITVGADFHATRVHERRQWIAPCCSPCPSSHRTSLPGATVKTVGSRRFQGRASDRNPV